MFDLPRLEGVEKVVISKQVVEGISPPNTPPNTVVERRTRDDWSAQPEG
jgi:hypothetical protein